MTAVQVGKKLEDCYRELLEQGEAGVPLNATPEQIEAWIDANVTDLQSAKAMMKRLAIDTSAIKRLLWRTLIKPRFSGGG